MDYNADFANGKSDKDIVAYALEGFGIPEIVEPNEGGSAEGLVLNQPAYHGSPHRFDKFTLDKIGTGEGAQAYGWGLYFAGNKEVADWYRGWCHG